MNLEPKKVEFCSLDFDEIARIHKHSPYRPEKDDAIKDIKVDLNDLGFRFHGTAKRTISILNTFVPELMLEVLKECARQAEYEAYLINNRRAVFESLKKCVYQMSLDKNRYKFDLRSSDITAINDFNAFIKFGIVTWEKGFTREEFRAQILQAYREFEEFEKTIYPDGAIVSEKLFDKYLVYYAMLRSDDYYLGKIVSKALETEDSMRAEVLESYCGIVDAITDSLKNNLIIRAEAALASEIKTA